MYWKRDGCGRSRGKRIIGNNTKFGVIEYKMRNKKLNPRIMCRACVALQYKFIYERLLRCDDTFYITSRVILCFTNALLSTRYVTDQNLLLLCLKYLTLLLFLQFYFFFSVFKRG